MTSFADVHALRLLDALPYALIAYDRDLAITAWNAATVRSSGIARSAVLGRTLLDVFPDIAGTSIEDEYRRALAGETVDARDRCWAPTGAELPRWYDVTYRPLYGDAGAVVGGVVITADVTARRGVEEAVVAERRLTRAILDTMPTGLVAFDRTLALTEWNAQAERTTGIRRGEVIGRAIGDVLPDHREGPFRSNYERVLTGETIRVRDRWYDTPLAPSRCYDATFAPLADGRGMVTGGIMISTDVTERASAERVVSDERAALRSIVDAAFAAIVVVDRAMTCTEWNRVAAAWSGVARETAVGQPLDRLLPPVSGSSLYSGIARALEGARTTSEEVSIFRGVGDGPALMLLTTAPRLDAIGSIAGAVIACLDVSEQARARQELKDSEARYRELFAQGAAIQVLMDAEHMTIAEANDRAVEFYGYPRAELIGMPASRLQPDTAESSALVDRLIRDGEGRMDRTHVTASGQRRRLEASARPVVRDGRTFVLTSMQDVTDRMAAEAARDRLTRIIDATPDLVATGDPETGQIGYLNAAGRALVGVGPEEVLTMADVLDPGELARVREVVIPAALREGVWQGDITLRRAQGAPVELSAVVLGHAGGTGDSPYVSTIGRDVTEDRRREVALREARAAADRASRAKTAFLATMSHELRTPLGAVIGFAQLLEEGGAGVLNETQQRYLRDILEGARHLRRVVDDSLDLARVEAGFIDLRPAPARLDRLIVEAIAAVQQLAIPHEVRILPPAEYPVRELVTDAARLRQVLLNLLTNAIKFNRHGGQVGVEVATLAGDRIRLVVRDTGRGIAAESCDGLFQEYERLGVTDVPGHGLGLAIVRRIVQAMGGSVGVESVLGEGSTFHIVLPRVLRDMPGPPTLSH